MNNVSRRALATFGFMIVGGAVAFGAGALVGSTIDAKASAMTLARMPMPHVAKATQR